MRTFLQAMMLNKVVNQKTVTEIRGLYKEIDSGKYNELVYQICFFFKPW